MLSFQEKRQAQRIVVEQNKLLAGNPAFSEKRAAQKIKLEAMAKLGMVPAKKEGANTNGEETEPTAQQEAAVSLIDKYGLIGFTDENLAFLQESGLVIWGGSGKKISFKLANYDGANASIVVDGDGFVVTGRGIDDTSPIAFIAAVKYAKEALLKIKERQEGSASTEIQSNQEEINARKSTAHLFDYDPNRKPAQRKRENTQAMALIRQIEASDVDPNALTDEQKATLAKYSGLGGALVGIDGQKGSAYEYYTPKPIAEGIWTLAKELGFNGGKVLDPSAGVGIFGATAPEAALIDAVELDKTSGTVNKLVNGGVGSTVTISPFEKVAASTPDEEYDAVITNVPFGKNSARGDNKTHDKRYQKESLQAYFILRSLEKLKPGGLAVFIVPPSVVSGLGRSEESLRVRASYMAEFLGAYRLPNVVFGTAQADTITDVITFRKYDKPAAEKIAELKEQSPDTLIAANVQWQEFTNGAYFKGEGKRFILGEFVPKDPNKYLDPDKVITNASVGEIGTMLRKFPDSRVDWAMLDAKETDAIMYQEGDTVTQAGQTLQWTNNRWVALESSQDDAVMAAAIADIKDPYAAFHAKVTYEGAAKIRNYMVVTGLALDMPGWFREAIKQLDRIPTSDRQKTFNAGVIGLACKQVEDERLSEETGVNYLEEYPQLSESMQRIAATAKASASKVGGELKQGLLKIGLHYTAKGGFSALWRGDVLQSVAAAQTTNDASFDGLLYKNKSPWATIEEAKVIYGDEFEPYEDSKWCLSSDGKKVTRADDYYTGNYADFLRRIDADIAAATDDQVIAKLLRQKLDANKYLDKVDVKSISFNLFSPHVSVEEKAEFLRRFVHPAATVVYDEKTGDKRVDIDIKIGKNSTDRDKLYNRFGDYMKNGTISLGGAKLGMKDIDALRELRRMVNTANEQFNGWAQSNPQIINKLEGKANNPALLMFRQSDDEEPMQIPGMNPELTLHGYQNVFVRRMGRDFGGINGFAVGLGKTFSALAAVQYAQAIGVKKKTLFVVPNSVLSNWRKEVGRAYASMDDSLFVGLRTNKAGKEVVQSAAIDADLSSIRENRHSKIFITFETFERIKLREETVAAYEAYLGSIDSNYTVSLNVKEREAANSRKASLKSILLDKTGAAPFLEDLGIDSIVIDEAHAYKNSSKVFEFKSAKFLSLGNMAKRGIDAQAKAWYMRGQSPRADGMLLLTATPITNSPLEIYSMLSLAKGHDKVNAMMLGIKGADDFMNMMTDIENEDDVTIDGIDRTTNVFVGLNNVDVLRRGIEQSSTIKSADDVGAQVALPDSEEAVSTVALTDSTVERLQLYKDAFRWAIDDLSGKDENRGDINAYNQVADYFGENQKLIAHPFNLINKMTLLIADPELDRRATFFTIAPGNLDKAKAVIADFNKKKILEKRPRKAPFTEEDAVVGRKVTTDDETGDQVEMLTIEVRAILQPDNKTIVIDTMDSQTQLRWDEMADKAGLDLDVTIPPKLASLLENVQHEQATPRGVDDEGNHSLIVKQIIFSDILGMHSKIKRLLAKKAGIPASQIAIITGKTNNTPEEILAVQDGFNAHGEDNKYRIIIANEKAEVGINLQKGTQAIHHLSIGWTPDSLTQRNGRGVRQGNKTEKVTIYNYDADGTFDAIKRDMVSKKASWIDSVMTVGGDNKVAISGGLSKEQVESLIDVAGDSDAISRIQESIAAKEAEARATTNLAKQKVNIDTIKKQRDFIEDNDPVKDFVIPKIASLFTLDQQISVIKARIQNPKATATVVFKNQAILGELEARKSGVIELLNSSVIIKYRDSDVLTAEEAVLKYKNSYAKKHTAEHFAESLGQTYSYTIEVIEGSSVHTEWTAELDMAKSMIESALSNFTLQAKQDGALPVEVGKAFAEGRGHIIHGEVVTVGTFFTIDDKIYAVNNEGNASFILFRNEGYGDYNGYGIPKDPPDGFILPGSSQYESMLIEAAKLEDASGFNLYSELVPEVAQYRTTTRVKKYADSDKLLPHPYFPIVIGEDQIKGDALLQSIYDEQSKIVLSREKRYSSLYFTVPYETEVEEKLSGLTLHSALMAYARAHDMQIPWTHSDDYWFKDAVKKEISSVINANDDDNGDVEALKALLPEDPAAMDAVFIDFIKGKVPFIDFEGADASNIRQLVPFDIWYAYEKAKGDAERRQRASGATVAPAVESKPAAGNDPDEVVGITGDTKPYYKQIKAAAESHGGGKFKWDGPNLTWNVKRSTWDRLIYLYPNAANDLKLVPSTRRI